MRLSEQRDKTSPVTALVVVALLLWLALVVFLGAHGGFSRAPGAWPFPILIGVTVPLLVFLAIFRVSRTFQLFVLTVDLRLVTGIQAWRFVGLGFLALYTYGVLPGRFAWPAGLGDMAIGLTAPWLVLALIRLPAFAAGRLFVLWNLVGILDLIVAVSMGAIVSGLTTSADGEITTAPMAQLPLVLIPALAVPFFVMLHLTALWQARRLTALGGSGIQTSPGAEGDYSSAQTMNFGSGPQRG
ncbi:MAG TPA: hypothetical protein VJV04_02850 [Nitrospiraceae bacterium]|nr:hypothetical protein [Nitrospiraceae bacterium]